MNNYKEVSDLLTSFSILVCFNEERIINRLLDGGIFIPSPLGSEAKPRVLNESPVDSQTPR